MSIIYTLIVEIIFHYNFQNEFIVYFHLNPKHDYFTFNSFPFKHLN